MQFQPAHPARVAILCLLGFVSAFAAEPTTAPIAPRTSEQQAIIDRVPRLSGDAHEDINRFQVEGLLLDGAFRFRVTRFDDQCSFFVSAADGTPLLVAADRQIIFYDARIPKLIHCDNCAFSIRVATDVENGKRALTLNFSLKFNDTPGKENTVVDAVDIDLPSFMRGNIRPLDGGRIELVEESAKGRSTVLLDPKIPGVVRRLELGTQHDQHESLQLLAVTRIAIDDVQESATHFPDLGIFNNLPAIEEVRLKGMADAGLLCARIMKAAMFRAEIYDPKLRESNSSVRDSWEKAKKKDESIASGLRKINFPAVMQTVDDPGR